MERHSSTAVLNINGFTHELKSLEYSPSQQVQGVLVSPPETIQCICVQYVCKFITSQALVITCEHTWLVFACLNLIPDPPFSTLKNTSMSMAPCQHTSSFRLKFRALQPGQRNPLLPGWA
ncbi:unnamed protein product [Rangifer tarandus platyrhynchus]|uniref:Uncharacterized protein n=2 Tax=Rangifer tarandus platyrhynchus TaxID=3082113 RepID=A0ABN8ZVI6_RANTA|nr:unnamed protein product [Rangifer tarandus platyrhynchus]